MYIQHARNKGEVRIGPYKVDGFCQDNKTIYEFNGCFWHGCSKCYDCNTPCWRNGDLKSMGDLYLETVEEKKIHH